MKNYLIFLNFIAANKGEWVAADCLPLAAARENTHKLVSDNVRITAIDGCRQTS